jgi:hypothetical protein
MNKLLCEFEPGLNRTIELVPDVDNMPHHVIKNEAFSGRIKITNYRRPLYCSRVSEGRPVPSSKSMRWRDASRASSRWVREG